MKSTHRLVVAILALTASSLRAQNLPEPVRAFFEKHCFACHDAATAKAKLSIDSLPANFTRAEWTRIHDRILADEMPPKNRRRPGEAERSAVLKWLGDELNRSAVERQKSQGRVPLRRMNRREYEATVHDLLGIAEPLQGLLPQDNPVHGFDTVSRGLETSAAHLLAYQRAADAAIDAALPHIPVASQVTRWTGRKYLEGRQAVHRKGIDPFVRTDGDALVLHAVLYGDNSMQAPHPPVPGRYRVRAAVRVVNNAGKPITVMIGKRVDRFQTEKLMHIIDFRDVPAAGVHVLEIETDLKYSQGNQFVYFEALGLPWFSEFDKQRGPKGKEPLEPTFAGPGLAIEWAELEGPLDGDLGVRRLFGDLPRLPSMPDGKAPPNNWMSWPKGGGEFRKYPLRAVSNAPKEDAARLIRAFLPLAMRRPATEHEVTHYAGVVQSEMNAGASFDEAMRAGYKAILCSPHFLTYVENPGKLDDFAVAARLARFLWNSSPDRELFDAAAKAALRRPEVLRAQTERMLRDPKSARFVRDFTGQWLDLAKFLEMKPDGIYAEYDDRLAWSMPLETLLFFEHVLNEDLPTATFFHSDWTFLNSRLARHYGIAGVDGLELRKVALKPEHRRGGIITHGSVLKLTTNASYTSPIKRGAWLLERILGTPPPPPPPDVTAVEPDIRGATTIREQLTKHKNVAVCASCHVRIDPPGFALENYDVLGGWRDRYRVKQGGPGNAYVPLVNYPERKVWLAKPVQADGETESGTKFRDIDEYKRIILSNPDQLTRNLAEKLIVYATGAELDFADRTVVEQIVRDVAQRRHGLRSLLHAVVQSPLFLNK